MPLQNKGDSSNENDFTLHQRSRGKKNGKLKISTKQKLHQLFFVVILLG